MQKLRKAFYADTAPPWSARKRETQGPCFVRKRPVYEPYCTTFWRQHGVAVLKWIRTLGSKLCLKIEPSPEDRVIVMEVDEFWHFIKKNNKRSGSSKPIIVMENDSSTGNLVIVLMQHF